MNMISSSKTGFQQFFGSLNDSSSILEKITQSPSTKFLEQIRRIQWEYKRRLVLP